MDDAHGSVGAWAKSYYFAVRAAMESILRPYDLGSTQFYVLYQLANHGPTMQRDLGRMLQIERATLSGIVATLVRKGLIDQMPGSEDQRQRVLRLTGAGMALWAQLPDPPPSSGRSRSKAPIPRSWRRPPGCSRRPPSDSTTTWQKASVPSARS